jgi:hypothetical protein
MPAATWCAEVVMPSFSRRPARARLVLEDAFDDR